MSNSLHSSYTSLKSVPDIGAVEEEESNALLSAAGIKGKGLQFHLEHASEDIGDRVTLIKGYQLSQPRLIFYYVLCLVSAGLLPLLCYWFPDWKIKITHYRQNFHKATCVVVQREDGGLDVCDIKTIKVDMNRDSSEALAHSIFLFTQESSKLQRNNSYGSVEVNKEDNNNNNAEKYGAKYIKIMEYRCLKYLWNPESDQFECEKYFDPAIPFSKFYEIYGKGNSESDRKLTSITFGKNLIDVPVKSYPTLLIQEVLHPFFIFQLVSITIWALDLYYVYAICIGVSTTLAAISNVYQLKKNMLNLREMALFHSEVNLVIEDPEKHTFTTRRVSSKDIVPGDVIEITNDFTVPCDCLLLSGSCIVNESMLTGESVPVIKTSVPRDDEVSSESKNKNYFDSPITSPLVQRRKGRNLLKDLAIANSKPETHNNPGSWTRFTLFGGTVAQPKQQSASEPVRALVTVTGFSTSKGELVRSILFPKVSRFSFYKDAFRFIAVSACIALIGFCFAIYQYHKYGASVGEMLIRGLDLFTIIIPPALPIALSVGTYVSIERLKKNHRIFCTSPNKITEAGKVSVACFDKTGTITLEGLDVLGAHPVDKATAKFLPNVLNRFEPQIGMHAHVDVDLTIEKCLLSCHSVSSLKDVLVGDPLDVKMFEYTRAVGNMLLNFLTRKAIEEPLDSEYPAIIHYKDKEDKLTVGILKRFDFNSALQRMSVISKTVVEHAYSRNFVEIYVKGSPEMIKKLSRPETLPANYETILREYTLDGYRVIACAGKTKENVNPKEAKQMSRNDCESDLTFLGFLIMSNQLKEDSADAIEKLKKANIKIVMITGDNPLTAVNVAKACGIVNKQLPVFLSHPQLETNSIDWIDIHNPNNVIQNQRQLETSQLAVTGDAYNLIHQDKIISDTVLRQSHVFARMTPQQKAQLVEDYRAIVDTVSMTGDGANDVSALKAANVGLSLSEAEASVAAPFTSKENSIQSVIHLFREGRCALVTSFHLFKYMAVYSLIQFSQVIILYNFGSILGDWQFLWIDLVLILPLAFAMGLTEPNKELTLHRPVSNLISKPVLISLFGQFGIQLGFMIGSVALLTTQDWYDRTDAEDNEGAVDITETTVIFLFCNFQYIMVVIAYSINYPFRKPLWTNKMLVILIAVQTLLCLYLVMYPDSVTSDVMQLVDLDNEFRFYLIGWIVLNCLVTYLFESVAVVWLFTHYFHKKQLEKGSVNYAFKKKQEDMPERIDLPHHEV